MTDMVVIDEPLDRLLREKRVVQFTKPFFPHDVAQAVAQDVRCILESGQLINGPFCTELERQLAAYHGRVAAAAVSTCTTALQICLQFLNLQGGEVLVPAAAFTTDVSAVKWAGGMPVLVDMDPSTLSFDLADLRRKLTKRTRALIWVHLAGLISTAWDNIVDFAQEHDLFLIEDCAHALGATIAGRRAGSFGDAACFSFYPTKIVTSGTGGAIVTDNEKLDHYAREVRFFGRENGTGRVVREGNDWLLDEVRAAVACAQFRQLDGMLERRRAIASLYDRALHGLNNVELVMHGKGLPSYYHYAVLLPSKEMREQLSKFLSDQFAIPARPIYPALQEEVVFRDLADTSLETAASGLARSLCLPMHPAISEDDVSWIAGCVRAGLARLA
jgi:dTDP-4-amino-4,6-dideoxygalactose transaminase